MNILFIAAECTPFMKVGGLADVVGSLPQALKSLSNVEVRVILPKYKKILDVYKQKMVCIKNFTIELGNKPSVYVGVQTLKVGSIRYYFIDNEFYFGSRDNAYNYGDESERFAYFQKAALESIKYLDFIPEVIHVHDWHTAMIPLLMKIKYPEYQNTKSVLTIHNLAYQGIFPINDYHYFNIAYNNHFEFEGFINFLKCGIVSSDSITTVSETYANEILTDYFGYGMQHLLKWRKGDLKGIVNGISYKEFDPLTDPLIAFNYDVSNYELGKKNNKLALYQELKLKWDPDYPLIGIVSRLVSQKGFDLIKRVFTEMLEQDNFKFIVLGDGEGEYVDYFNDLQNQFPHKVKVYVGYSNKLAHLIYASSDLFLMPSKFEPCGLGQLIALKYGTLPIVRETGGLVDTVHPYNEFTGEGNGFSFQHFNAHDMMYVIRYALKVYYQKKDAWQHLVLSAMAADYSWNVSAKAYKKIYSKLIKGKKE
ncbi:MAG: glycogen synthase GlgA [Tenericutes bacterium HGW-Tenericutes-1]|nr:MAG: glycogen synthase GlgA [Tenericutes bacterium HGW-Tenericutes-1]